MMREVSHVCIIDLGMSGHACPFSIVCVLQ